MNHSLAHLNLNPKKTDENREHRFCRPFDGESIKTDEVFGHPMVQPIEPLQPLSVSQQSVCGA